MEKRLWMFLFFAVLSGYALYYAPYGIDESDGGFMTGLAWQWLSGKTLYSELLYARPPLPVWLRAATLCILPDQWAILGERWVFYAQVGLYSWLGASLLAQGAQRWQVALFSFVVSVHCYAPFALHTFDGILFCVLAVWLSTRRQGGIWAGLLAGVAVAAATLCKQSFYPFAPMFALYAWAVRDRSFLRTSGLAFAGVYAAFFIFLLKINALQDYLRLVGGAGTGSKAFETGILNYFRINPLAAAGAALTLLSMVWGWRHGGRVGERTAFFAWGAFLVWLAAYYLREVLLRQECTAPFASSRLLFWVGLAYAGWALSAVGGTDGPVRGFSQALRRIRDFGARPSDPIQRERLEHAARFILLLGITWCAAVSWGFHLPILFSTPYVFAVVSWSRILFQKNFPQAKPLVGSLVALVLLLGVFRVAYEFVYRDGRRAEMHRHLGEVFPQLSGIYSSDATFRRYAELRDLAQRYGPSFKTLPYFTRANYLTKTHPPLPNDWVAVRETGADDGPLWTAVAAQKPVFFVEKSMLDKVLKDPELRFSRQIWEQGERVEETEFFVVMRFGGGAKSPIGTLYYGSK